MSEAVAGTPVRNTWLSLLNRAAALYDEPGGMLAKSAGPAALGGFASGACWMRHAMERLRGAPLDQASIRALQFQTLGVLKYGAASVAASSWTLAAYLIGWPLLIVLAVPLFYAIEAQSVFLFPVVLDGHPHPFRAASRWTVRAGGTVRVMAIVMPIAATMLCGGFVGRGFLRSWCLGCLAICIWYEDLRTVCDVSPLREA